MFIRCRLPILLFMLICYSPALQAAPQPAGHEALAGLESARVIFDVRVADLETLIFNLRLSNETWEEMAAQGFKPEMVVAFRGPTVKLLTASALDDEAMEVLRTLKKKGVRL